MTGDTADAGRLAVLIGDVRPDDGGHQRPRQALRVLVAVVIAGTALAVLLGRAHDLQAARHQLGRARPLFVLVGIAAEGLSIFAFSLLEHHLLSRGAVRPGYRRVLGITLGGTALQNSLPAGSAWSTVFAIRQFHRHGAGLPVAAWVVVVQGSLVLAVLAAMGAV